MTIYLYRCEDGHEHELDYPMGQAPDVLKYPEGYCHVAVPIDDKTVRMCSKPLRRVFTVPQIVHGPGFIGPGLAPWSDKVQKSKEAQERFGKGML